MIFSGTEDAAPTSNQRRTKLAEGIAKAMAQNYNSKPTVPAKDLESTKEDEARRRVIIGVAVIAALAIGAVFYFLMRSAGSGVSPQASLQGAIRPGAPEWEQFRSKIILEPPEADSAPRPLGDIVMRLWCTVRNFTGQTITGLEVKGTVVDSQGNPVRERIVVIVPSEGNPELGPNKTMTAMVRIEGFKESDNRANIKMELTGFRLRP